MKIAIIDYGMGNIWSVKSALNYIGVENIEVSDKAAVLNSADKILLPGVGHFATAMDRIKQTGLIEVLSELVFEQKKPILGICLGMQLLAKSSTEGGMIEGLGFIDASVTRFDEKNLSIPHVGFNQVENFSGSRLYNNLSCGSDFYFTHSYRMLSNCEIGQSFCDYGGKFIASYEKDNIAGVQFHPELSQKNGLQLLKNFVELF